MNNDKILKYCLKLELRLKSMEDLLKIKYQNFNNKKRSEILRNQKCCSIYNKSDLGQLFYILMDEQILFFDPNNQKINRSKMQNFIVENFSYNGDAGTQVNIDSISKQFSECKGFTYREKQIKFLNELLTVIQKRKEKLMQW